MDRSAAQLALVLIALTGAGNTWGHGGGLNADGCHTNRKTGDYHCHRHPPANSSGQRAVAPARLAPAGAMTSERAPAGRMFVNCAEARKAGAAPVRRGDPGYGPHLDRDNDGIGCEPPGR